MASTKSQHSNQPYSFYELALIVGIIIAAFVMRYYGIDRQSLWADELFGISTALSPHFVDIIPRLLADSHPPGYLSFLYFYVPLFGDSELQLRLHSLIAGTALVLITYFFGRRYFSAATGLLGALLLAVNYESIYYSQEARAYAMLAVTCLLSLYYFLGFIINGTCSNKDKFLFVIFSSAAMYLHYSGVVFVGCEGIIYAIALCHNRSQRFFIEGLIIFSVLGLLYAPWLGTMYHHMIGFSDYWGGSQVVDSKNLVSLADFLLGPYWGYSQYFFLGSWLLCFTLGLQILFPKRWQFLGSQYACALLITACIAAMPIAVFYIKSQISMPVFQERHFVILTPLIMLMAAAPTTFFIDKLSFSVIRYAILSLLLLTLGWKQTESNIETGLYRLYTKDPIREAFSVVLADKDFMAGKNPMVLTTHWQMDYYLLKKNHFPKIGSSIYNADHYQHLAKELADAGSFYFISINPAEQHASLTASMADFSMQCRRELQSRSGIVSVVKMVFKNNASQPIPPTAVCAPEMAFTLPLR